MLKNNQKCVRMSNTVLKIVESYAGEGFNQKFENLVIDFKKTQPEREAYIKSLDENINQKKTRINDLSRAINRAENINVLLDDFLTELEHLYLLP